MSKPFDYRKFRQENFLPFGGADPLDPPAGVTYRTGPPTWGEAPRAAPVLWGPGLSNEDVTEAMPVVERVWTTGPASPTRRAERRIIDSKRVKFLGAVLTVLLFGAGVVHLAGRTPGNNARSARGNPQEVASPYTQLSPTPTATAEAKATATPKPTETPASPPPAVATSAPAQPTAAHTEGTPAFDVTGVQPSQAPGALPDPNARYIAPGDEVYVECGTTVDGQQYDKVGGGYIPDNDLSGALGSYAPVPTAAVCPS